MTQTGLATTVLVLMAALAASAAAQSSAQGGGGGGGRSGDGGGAGAGAGAGGNGGSDGLLPQERARAFALRAVYFRREAYARPVDCLTAAYTQRLPLDLCQ